MTTPDRVKRVWEGLEEERKRGGVASYYHNCPDQNCKRRHRKEWGPLAADSEWLTSHTWSVLSQALAAFATQGEPGGDDSVFDYFPNALSAITGLYRLFSADRGTVNHHDFSGYHIESWELHHISEAISPEMMEKVAQVYAMHKVRILADYEYQDATEMAATFGVPVEVMMYDRPTPATTPITYSKW